MKTISTFPVLTDELVQKIRLQTSPFRFTWIDSDGEETELVAEDSMSSAHPISDEKGRWSPDTDGFNMSRSYTIRSASFLYGKDGVAPKSATLGLALIWESPDSRQRSAHPIGTIENSMMPQSLNLNIPFSKPQFKGRLVLKTAVVLLKAGAPEEGEEALANTPGTVLGVVDTYSLLFDGSGSAFPVSVVSKPDGLLWSVDCDLDDPTTDKFDDCVSINLNKAHRDYKYINPADKANYNPSFLREVLAGALSTIVDCIRETDSWDDIKNGRVEEESVGQAVHYFAKALDLNLDDAKQCSVPFRKYFEQKLSEI